MQVTQKAAEEIKKIQIAEKVGDVGALRVSVIGGGCSGMSYQLGFDPNPPTNNDKILEQHGVRVVVDAKSYLFLDGTELDFTDGLNGRGFVFNNPNAKKTCGCGSSFSA